jgi:hypothetical protein
MNAHRPPLLDVLEVVAAVRNGEKVDLVAVRASLTAKNDQIAASARTTPGLEPLIEMHPHLLAALDALDDGDVGAAVECVGDLFRPAP